MRNGRRFSDDAQQAWTRGSGRCWHCGRLLRQDQYLLSRPAGWVVEHHLNGALGLRMVCWGCHELKGELSDADWAEILEEHYPGRGPTWRNRRLVRKH
jgi:hypothetical protein